MSLQPRRPFRQALRIEIRSTALFAASAWRGAWLIPVGNFSFFRRGQTTRRHNLCERSWVSSAKSGWVQLVKKPAVSILIVEDELIVAEDLRRRLKAMGYDVMGVVSSGDEAIQRVEEKRPDLVLMDISLRGEMDGVAAAERIRERFGTPVVYITGHGDPDTLQRAKSTPGFAFVMKPVEDREMHYIVEMVLKREHESRRPT